MKIKDTCKGIVLALIAAYFYPLVAVFSPFNIDFWINSTDIWSSLVGIFFVIPVWGLMLTWWYVIPIGAVLGYLIPHLVRGNSLRDSMIYGLLLGCVIGLIGSIHFYFPTISASLTPEAGLYDFLKNGLLIDFGCFLLKMITYSAFWIVGYIYLIRRKLDQDPNAVLLK